MKPEEIHKYTSTILYKHGKWPQLRDMAKHFNVNVIDLIMYIEDNLGDWYEFHVVPKQDKYDELVKLYNE